MREAATLGCRVQVARRALPGNQEGRTSCKSANGRRDREISGNHQGAIRKVHREALGILNILNFLIASRASLFSGSARRVLPEFQEVAARTLHFLTARRDPKNQEASRIQEERRAFAGNLEVPASWFPGYTRRAS